MLWILIQKASREIFSGRRFIYFKLTRPSLLDQAEYRTEIDPQLAQLITGGGVSHVISQPNGQPALRCILADLLRFLSSF